ncbi:MAG TPA: YdeI/OmpD-associated family protein [Vicinamibacterales bacterium]|nr:YdeI/OmpD-associated family protein [Vicinamibacterales bacterium]
MKPTFFATPAAFRAWLKKHHKSADELWVGYYRKDSGKPSITWQESVDEALCFGWIDGIRKKVSDKAYTNRFTPRRAGSNWSAINIAKVEELTKTKRMQAAGLAAFAKRTEAKSRIYSYESLSVEIDKPFARKFKANKQAWAFFQTQPPYYRRIMTGWVNGAKQEETRLRRLDKLMAACERGKRFMP